MMALYKCRLLLPLPQMWLEDFYVYCLSLGGDTAIAMKVPAHAIQLCVEECLCRSCWSLRPTAEQSPSH